MDFPMPCLNTGGYDRYFNPIWAVSTTAVGWWVRVYAQELTLISLRIVICCELETTIHEAFAFGHFSKLQPTKNEDGVDLSKRFLIIFRSLIDGKGLYQFIAISMGRMMMNDDKWEERDDHMMINHDKQFFCWVKSPWFHGPRET